MRIQKFVLLILLLMPTVLSAHYIWIECESEKEARIYFGEIQDGEREKSPGKLDKIVGLRVFLVNENAETKEVPAKKNADFFSAMACNADKSVLATSLDVPVADMKKYQWGMVKPMYYARFGGHKTKAVMRPVQALDIVPQPGTRPGKEAIFQVFFKGMPLANEKLVIYAPNTWSKEYKTNAEGKIKLVLPWSGQYVLEVIHTEKTEGTFQGAKYENLRHRATYTTNRK